MKLELTKKQYRRLLDMVYIGNWVLNSTRGEDRIPDYDEVESLLFSKARDEGMGILAEVYDGEVVPSRAFAEGGIHEAIMDYEDSVFFDILAEDLARRDMDDVPIDDSNCEELNSRIDAYIAEFEEHGTDNLTVDSDILYDGAAVSFRSSRLSFSPLRTYGRGIGWFYRDVARRPVLRPGAFSRSPAHSGRPGDIPGDKFAYTCH